MLANAWHFRHTAVGRMLMNGPRRWMLVLRYVHLSV